MWVQCQCRANIPPPPRDSPIRAVCASPVAPATIAVADGGGAPLTIRGVGFSSTLLWDADSDLFTWLSTSPTAEVLVADLCIASTSSPKSPTSAALRFKSGVVKSVFQNLLFLGAGAVPGTSITTQALGTCIYGGVVTDTVTITDVVMWFLQGTGVYVGHGSEVRIIGGRIIGLAVRNDGSIGVHVTGNNGGVHVIGTDVIALQYGVVLDNSSGAGSNREIFINQATMDSNQRGAVGRLARSVPRTSHRTVSQSAGA